MTSTSSRKPIYFKGFRQYYHVVCGRLHMDIVVAVSHEEAIEQVEKKFGPSLVWNSTEKYKAYLCDMD